MVKQLLIDMAKRLQCCRKIVFPASEGGGNMENSEYIRPPGTYYAILPHPDDREKAVEIAVVQDHRFAFFYWLKWLNTKGLGTTPPCLVSLDWHQDLADPDELEKEWLQALDRDNYKDAAVFCWDKLSPLNDGHILAAAYLNLVGDIHVLQKQDGPSVRSFEDLEGRMHTVNCYDSLDALQQALNSGHQPAVFFDIDLDFFTESSGDCGGEDVELVSAEEINRCLNPYGDLMRWVFPRMCGMSIATEPEFCGGLMNSNQLLSAVSDILFQPPLLSEESGWRHLA